jgi:hypothetical protein
MASTIPGFIAAAFYMVVIWVLARRDPANWPSVAKVGMQDRLRAMVGVWGITLITVAVVAGLFAGIFTPTESAAVGCILTLGVGVARRDMGLREVLEALRATAETTAMIFAIVLGVPAGVIAASRRGGVYDQTLMGLALTGYSMPIFWWGLLLIMFMSGYLGLTPVSGRISLMYFFPSVTGFMLFFVMRAMGELLLSDLSYKSFADCAEDILGPWAGFTTGWSYWFAWIVTAIAELIAIAGYFSFWWPDLPTWFPALASVAVLNMDDAGDMAPAAAMALLIFACAALGRGLLGAAAVWSRRRTSAWRTQ